MKNNNSNAQKSNKDVFRKIKRVIQATLALNLVVTFFKLLVGYMTDTLSLVANGFDSLFDSTSNILGLVGVRLASRPADRNHPYGHRKMETIFSLVVAFLLFLTTWELLETSIGRLLSPGEQSPRVGFFTYVILGSSAIINAFVAFYESRAGKKYKSDFLVSDAKHTATDVIVSCSVIVGMAFIDVGVPLLDPMMAIGIAIIIGKIGIDIIRETLPALLDQAAISPEEVCELAKSIPGVLSCHDVRSRGHVAAMFVDLHLHVDPATSTRESHAIAHEVKRRVMETFQGVQDVMVHVEPEE